jgi:hypothetical protein
MGLTSSDLARLHHFRISDDLIELSELRRVTDHEAREDYGIHYQQHSDLSGVVFPIFGADGQIKGYRVRRDNPEVRNGKPDGKYIQSVDRSHLYFERSSRKWLTDVSVPVIFVEAYTSALAIASFSQRIGRPFLIIATGGCYGWSGRIGKIENEKGVRVDEKGPSPDLDHIPFTGRDVVICFDGNVASNINVQIAEQNFRRELERHEAVVHLARIPQEQGINGPDDFLAVHSDEDFMLVIECASYEPWPEPQSIEAALSPVPALPAALIPDPFQDWLTDASERIGCPLDFVTVAALVVTGSVIGAGCGIRPKRKDDWTVVPNLWGGVVGRPSIMLKTPALQEAMRPLDRLATEARDAHQAAIKDFEGEQEIFKARKEAARDLMKAAAKGKKNGDRPIDMAFAKNEFTNIDEPPEPTWRRYKTNDATIEKLGELLSDNPRGLLVFRDELIGLLSQWDRDGREGDRAFFLEAWNGTGSHETDRIGRGSIRIENACVSILGGIQPAKLTSYLYAAIRGTDNDGLIQRLQLLVYPDEPEAAKLIDRFPNSDAKNKAYTIIKTLAEMDFLQAGATLPEDGRIPFFRFDDAAQNLFYKWFDDLSERLRADDEPIITEHLGKFKKLMPSLALIFHLIEIANGTVSGPIPEITAKRAMAWCDFLEAHARRIYGLVTNIAIEAAARLAKHIKAGELGTGFTARDVYRRHWSILSDRGLVEFACEHLIDLGWLRKQEPILTGGRPQSTKYLVNPRLAFGTFGTASSPRLEGKK